MKLREYAIVGLGMFFAGTLIGVGFAFDHHDKHPRVATVTNIVNVLQYSDPVISAIQVHTSDGIVMAVECLDGTWREIARIKR